MRASDGGHKWHDYMCGEEFAFVCKRPLNFKEVNDKFEYSMRMDKQSWANARKVCNSWGGDLATINQWTEQRHALKLVTDQMNIEHSTVGRAWINGKAIKDDWTYANGDKMDWRWFDAEAHSEGCAEIYTPNARGKWNNNNCDAE